MCKFWRREKSNHHFPELSKRKDIMGFMKLMAKPLIAAPVLLVLIFFIGFLYLTQTNITATKGYKIKDLEKQLSMLQKDNKQLKLNYIEMQSMANMIDKSAKLKLVPAGKLEIISNDGVESSMAIR